MEITFFGHACIRIRGKQKTVIIDPYDEKVGKLLRDLEADITLVTHDHFDHNAVARLKQPGFVIDGPGEYEIGGVSVIGIATHHDDKGGAERGGNTMYVVEIDNLRLIHTGDLGHKLSQETLEEIGAIDVLMLPVGGIYTLDAKTAKEVVTQVDPWVVVPMHYKTADFGLKELTTVDDFLKEMGRTETAAVPKYSISADRLPEELQIIVLSAKY